jgi:hypothetical protein
MEDLIGYAMKRTKPLTMSLTARVNRRNAASRSAANRRRCPECSGFLDVQGNHDNPRCSMSR